MLARTLFLSGALAVLAATAGWSSDYASAPGRPRADFAQESRHGASRLPHELKIMWRKEEHPRLKAMPRDERKGWIKRQWASMTDQQKQTKLAELQKKWDALPENVRQHLIQKRQQRHEAHRFRRQDEGAPEQKGASSRMHSG